MLSSFCQWAACHAIVLQSPEVTQCATKQITDLDSGVPHSPTAQALMEQHALQTWSFFAVTQCLCTYVGM